MQRIFLFLLLLFLPLAALADGMVVPTIAYPAKITIPDQRALICFSNGTERLVIETRFTGAGTNFAWVVPLPSQPVIEEATTGLFPTLQFLFQSEIVHEVARYYSGILALIGIGYLLLIVRPSGGLKWLDGLACICVGVAVATASHRDSFNPGAFCVVTAILFFLVFLIRVAKKSAFAVFGLTFLGFLFLAGLLLPALSAAKRTGMSSETTSQAVSVLDRKLVGIFETTTITSRDPKALENWLRENGFAVSTNAEPIIASYIKDGWVFVATKIRRDKPDNETSTPHPLSFTFKTDKLVYPMRLTGLNTQSLSVELYVFGQTRAEAPHFKVERCTRPNYPAIPDTYSNWIYRRHQSPEAPDIFHPLLRQWTTGLPVATKLTATLSPADMSNDIWLDQAPFFFEQKTRLFSRQGALTTALNWGVGLFAACLLAVCLSAFAGEPHKTKVPRRIGIVALASIVLVGLVYLSLPKTQVKLLKASPVTYMIIQQLGIRIALGDYDWHTTAQARASLQEIISNPTNPVVDPIGWTNYFTGSQIREEDSPGNYLLRETNNQLALVFFYPGGEEEIDVIGDLPAPH